MMNKIREKGSSQRSLRSNLRIIWALVFKDLIEALKNKSTLAVLLTAIPMVFFYYYLPILGDRGEPPVIRAYDAGESVLVALLENSDAVRFRAYPSEERMNNALMQSESPEIGLVIPEGFDQAAAEGGQIEVQADVMHWVDAGAYESLRSLAETEISRLTGVPVQVQREPRLIYPTADAGGLGVSAGIALVYVVVIIGLTLAPHLMLEEKKTGAIDALLVSPANEIHLVVGKALVGMFYCLIGGGIALLVFRAAFLHWWLAIAAMALLALFAVSLGLILGIVIESREQMTLYAWFIIIPLFIPMFIALLEELVPDYLVSIMRLVPSSLSLNLIRISVAGQIPWMDMLLKLAGLFLWTAAGLTFGAWTLRRQKAQERISRTSRRVGLHPETESSEGFLEQIGDKVSGILEQFSVRESGRSRDSDPVRESNSLQIVLAIAAKDLGQAVRNRIMLSIMLGTGLIVVSNAVLPLLLRANDRPIMFAYDQGRSTIIRALAASDDLRLGIVESWEDLEDEISQRPEIALGVVIPDNFDELAGSSEEISLDAYVVHWADERKINQRVAFFETQLGNATWGTVRIRVSPERMYPAADAGGHLIMNGLVYLLTLMAIGVALVPLLIVEERQSHTLEVLLVSPANIYQIIAGKGLVGVFYCLITAVVVFAAYQYLVVHWGLAVLAAILGALFAVSLGLLVGVISDNPTTVGLYGSLILFVLSGLTILNSLVEIAWASWAEQIIAYLPTSALYDLFSYTLVKQVPIGLVWANVGALLVASGLVIGCVAWALRRYDR